jgi:hypothetical protein
LRTSPSPGNTVGCRGGDGCGLSHILALHMSCPVHSYSVKSWLDLLSTCMRAALLTVTYAALVLVCLWHIEHSDLCSATAACDWRGWVRHLWWRLEESKESLQPMTIQVSCAPGLATDGSPVCYIDAQGASDHLHGPLAPLHLPKARQLMPTARQDPPVQVVSSHPCIESTVRQTSLTVFAGQKAVRYTCHFAAAVRAVCTPAAALCRAHGCSRVCSFAALAVACG